MDIIVLKFSNKEKTKVIMHKSDNFKDLEEFMSNNGEITEFFKQTPKTERVFIKLMMYSFDYNEKNDKLELKERVIGEYVIPNSSEISVWKTDIEARFPITEN